MLNNKIFNLSALSLFFFLLLINFSSASNFGVNGIYDTDSVTTGGNYSINVNNTEYFRGYSPTTFRTWLEGWYCKLTGCTITGDLIVNGNIENYGTESFVNSTFLIDGNIADGNATLVIKADVNKFSCIDMKEGDYIGFRICYDGSGTNRGFVISNFATNYEYLWIDRETGLVTLNGNTIVNGNLTADYFIGSGAELTDLNVTGVMNVTGDFTGYAINISFLYGSAGIGGMDLRGDPWWLGGVNLEVDENITADTYFGDGSQLTGIEEADTLQNVTDRGSTTTNNVTFEGNITQSANSYCWDSWIDGNGTKWEMRRSC